MKQPASVLNQRETNNEFLAAKHTFLKHVANDDREWVFVVNIIKDITKELNNKTEDILDEITTSLDEIFGNDTTAWTEVDILEVCLDLMSRIVARVYVGLPLARNKTYLGSTAHFAKFILVEALLAQLTPKPLRPLLSPALMQYDWMQFKRQDAVVIPIIRERAAAGKEDHHNDMLSRLMTEAYRRGDDPTQHYSHTTKVLAILNWAAVQVQAITLDNALIDIAHAPRSEQLQDMLREEAAAADKVEDDSVRWRRAEVSKLAKMDSVLTESLRLWGFSHGVIKVVAAREGIHLPTGEHIPCGTKIGVGSYGVHHDEEVVPGEADPFTFDPFRYIKEGGETRSASGLKFATTNDSYLAFSHGNYAWYVESLKFDHLLIPFANSKPVLVDSCPTTCSSCSCPRFCFVTTFSQIQPPGPRTT